MMNRQELADLIFPEAKDISYYEEKYPERDLPEGAVVTRFAPSPPGLCISARWSSVLWRRPW